MKPIPLEVLVNLLAQAREKKSAGSSEKSSEDTRTHTYHIVDMTDQHVGESLIITGAELPNNQPIAVEPGEAPGTGIITPTEKPPRK
jgi:hypothetical protein